jgi:hypothetical protein
MPVFDDDDEDDRSKLVQRSNMNTQAHTHVPAEAHLAPTCMHVSRHACAFKMFVMRLMRVCVRLCICCPRIYIM